MSIQSLEETARDIFFSSTNGRLVFDVYPSVFNERAVDVLALQRYSQHPTLSNLQRVFSGSKPDHISSLRVGKGFGGEWLNKVEVGESVSIGNNCYLMGHGTIRLGNNVKIGNDVMIVTDGHGLHKTQRHLNRYGTIEIGDNSIIEDGAMILHTTNDQVLNIPPNSMVKRNTMILRPHDVGKTDAPVGGTAFDRLSAAWSAVATEVERDDALEYLGNDNLVVIPPVYVGGQSSIHSGTESLHNAHSILIAQSPINIGYRCAFAPKSAVFAAEDAPVSFGDFVWVSAKATIKSTPGKPIHIGEGALIAAGAYVNQSVPPHALVVGDNKILKIISDQDIQQVPEEWMNREGLKGLVDDTIRQFFDRLSVGTQGPSLK